MNSDAGGFGREAAESLLRIRLPQEDCNRVNQLAEKSRQESLAVAEEAELENYRRVGRLLELIKSKARQSLNG
jgi:uncharacterized protein YnzC (UPF0291/DUF896 family)